MPFSSDELGKLVTERADEAGLRGDCNSGTGDKVYLVETGNSKVFDAVGKGVTTETVLAINDDLDGQVNGRVANGVQGNGPTRAIDARDSFPVGRGIIQQVSAVMRMTAVVLRDCRGCPEERAVHKDLDRSERKPVVSKTCSDTQINTSSVAGIVQVVCVPGDGVQSIEGGHQLGPGMEPFVAERLLVRLNFDGAVAYPAPGNSGLGKTGDALLGVPCGRIVQCLHNVRNRIGQQQVLDQGLGRFLDHSGGIAVSVAQNGPTGRIRETGLEYTRQPKRGGIGDGEMPGDMT